MSAGARLRSPPAVSTASPTAGVPNAGESSMRFTRGGSSTPRPTIWPVSRCGSGSVVGGDGDVDGGGDVVVVVDEVVVVVPVPVSVTGGAAATGLVVVGDVDVVGSISGRTILTSTA